MTDATDTHNRGTEMQRRLEMALAVGRGMEFVDDFTGAMRKIVTHDQASRQSFIPEMFFGIHKTLFSDTHQHPDDSHPAGEAISREIAGRLRQTLSEFVEQVFDSNGFVRSMSSDDMARTLAKSYHRIRELKPFAYGNRHTLNLFLHCIGSMPDFAERFPERIDFRRLDERGREWLLEGSEAEVEKAIKQAMDFSKTPRLQNDVDGFGKWSSSTVNISGMPFVTHQKDGIQYLVTVNGGLVKRADHEAKLKQFIEDESANHIFSDFRVVPEAYLDIDTIDEHGQRLKLKDKRIIDGYVVEKNGAVPLLHTGINPITGLSRKNHDRVVDFIKKIRGDKYPIYRLNENKEADAVINAAPEYLKPRIRYACEHISRVTKQMDNAVDQIFAGKNPVAEPEMVMTMGGGGSGKSSATSIIKALNQRHVVPLDNFVEASLDKARDFSDIYRVLKAVDHHADDYTTVEPMANEIRRWVAERARGMDKLDKHNSNERYNILYDGTGIEYKGRYDKIVEAYKKQGFGTTVCMVDTLLDIPEERQEIYRLSGIKRILQRAENDKRALPWKVVTDKHTRVAPSFMDAVRHGAVDKAVAFCNDGPLGTQYIIAETFKAGDGVVKGLRDLESKGELNIKGYVTSCLDNDETSILKLLHPTKATHELLEAMPVFDNENAGLLSFRLPASLEGKKSDDRILAITDMTRFIDVAEKALMNNTAAGPSTLFHAPRRVAPFIPHVGTKDDGHVQRHEARESYVARLGDRWNQGADSNKSSGGQELN